MKTIKFRINHQLCVLAQLTENSYLLNMNTCVVNLFEPTVRIETLKNTKRVVINDSVWFDTEQADAILEFFNE